MSKWLGNRLLAQLNQAQLEALARKVRGARGRAAAADAHERWLLWRRVLARVEEAPGCDSVHARIEDRGPTLNQELEARGLSTAPVPGTYRKRILRDGVDVFEGTASDVWEWLHSQDAAGDYASQQEQEAAQ